MGRERKYYGRVTGTTKTINRILDVILHHMDENGVWEHDSIIGIVADSVGLTAATTRKHIRTLENVKIIARARVMRRTRDFGRKQVENIRLLKPNHIVVQRGGAFTAIERE